MKVTYHVSDLQNAINIVGGAAAKAILRAGGRFKALIGASRRSAARGEMADSRPTNPFSQSNADNDQLARDWWDQKRAAQAAGEPIPDLPADAHNARQLERLGTEREAIESFANSAGKAKRA